MKKQILGLTAASLFAFSAQAGDLSYNFAEIGYETGTVEDILLVDLDLDGVYLKGSFAATENIHAFFNYNANVIDFLDGDEIEAPSIEIGGGYNYAVSDTVDVIAQLAYISQNVDVSGPTVVDSSDDDSGFGLNLGVRSSITPEFEASGFVKYKSVWADPATLDGDTTSFVVGGVYNFTSEMAGTLDAEFGDLLPDAGASSIRIGFRYNF